MRHGEIVEHAPVETLLRASREDYTRSLLKAVPSLIPRPARPPAETEPVLEVRRLTKLFETGGLFKRGRTVKAAHNVEFDIRRGRTLGIVGESGSGKSTVARCVMRLLDPTDGEIRVAGSDIATLDRRALRPHRKKIQMVFQDPFRSLNPRWTIGESLIEGVLNFGRSREEALREAGELVQLVGLPPDVLERYPHQFSGGQRQRIAIARAVAMRPDILVADEAVSALDVSVQAQVLKLIDELQAKLGIAVLFITHDLRVAAQICDEVIVMRHGAVVEHDTAQNVLARPVHDYTRALIEAAPGRNWDFANSREIAPRRGEANPGG